MGVKHVLDSRSTTFVDDVRRITNGGVDVVLNSLAAEAMERSIACLRPFGLFHRVGKRDYVTNTQSACGRSAATLRITALTSTR